MKETNAGNQDNKLNNKDYTDGDHSFKNFMRIMWQNTYIQLVCLAIVFGGVIIWNRSTFAEAWHVWFLCGIPVTIIVIIIAKALQFWDDLKNGRTR